MTQRKAVITQDSSNTSKEEQFKKFVDAALDGLNQGALAFDRMDVRLKQKKAPAAKKRAAKK